MADTQHTPKMSALDNFTVVLYRSGIVIMALSLVAYIVAYSIGQGIFRQFYIPVFALGAALSSANVHLYDPRFRWLIPLMSWMGFVMLAFSSAVSDEAVHHFLRSAALGFFYAGAGMFAVKEQFCFKIPGLKTVPLFLAMSVILRYFQLDKLEVYSLVPAAMLLLVLAVAKWRMPLHFDVGDKSSYTI